MKTIAQILSLILISFNMSFSTDPSAILFRGSYNAAKQQACKEKKLLLLEFTAKWCQPCRFMEKEVFGNNKVQDFANANLIIYKVDIDDSANKRLVEEHNIEVLPTTILMRASGQILSRKEQSFNPESFIAWVKDHKSKLMERFNKAQENIEVSQNPIEMVLPETIEPDHSELGLDIQNQVHNELEGFEKSEAPLPSLYYVQSGSYNSREEAEEAALKLVSIYKMEVKIAEIRTGQRFEYTVHVGLFDTREEATLLNEVMINDRFIAEVKSY